MKKSISIMLILLLCFGAAGCGAGGSTAKAAAQKAAALLNDGTLPQTDEELAELAAKLEEKYTEMDTAAADAGFAENDYYITTRDDVLRGYQKTFIKSGIERAASLSGDEKTAAVKETAGYILQQWSELDDFSARMSGYIGLCRALCEGNDLFNMQDDAQDMTGDGTWPTGYFFDGLLPEIEGFDVFYLCEDYLRGYGMDDASLCSFGKKTSSVEEAEAYVAQLNERGLYTYAQEFNDDIYDWYGCWVGDDGITCYVWVEYAPVDSNTMMQDFSSGCELTVVTGNFDFNLLIDMALASFRW